MKKILLLLSIFISATMFAQNVNKINIVPAPAEIKVSGGSNFTVTKNTVLVLGGSGLENISNLFNDYMQSMYGIKLKISKKEIEKNSIVLNYERMDKPIQGAYTIKVNNNGVYVSGDNEQGVFYGIQTLLQLLPSINPKSEIENSKLEIPQLSITDYPRFAYRGMHLDVGRHFMPVDLIQKYIDYIALHKINYFHWHLTEDQGWRIEIKKYPKLTQVGAWRNGTIIGKNPGTGNDNIKYGGYYTQEEIKDVVAYAQRRYITIIPEIEMPGHASAAIAAYPELSCFPDESTKHRKGVTWSGDTTG